LRNSMGNEAPNRRSFWTSLCWRPRLVILLDTNAIVYHLHRVEPYAFKVKQVLMERENLAVTMT
jgi:hypothetical protein